MILEGIVTTENADRTVNIAPMGPTVDEAHATSGELAALTLRPFRDSTTYANLRRTARGVFHVVDDAELLAQAAIGRLDPLPDLTQPDGIDGWILSSACRWYAFHATAFDEKHERVTISAQVTASGRIRDFVGFHRARHAVVEAAIVVTRVHLLSRAEVMAELDRADRIVAKTGGESERRAMQILRRHVDEYDGTPRAVRVQAPSRLHFGLLSFGQPEGRQFGGAGVMIHAPGIELRTEPAVQFDVVAEAGAPDSIAERARPFAERVLADLALEQSPTFRLHVARAPDQHMGLGTGTQLGLSVAAAIHTFLGHELPAESELARMLDRGRRSWVGLYGFRRGGMIVEAGRARHEPVAPLVARTALPDAWRFVLICPGQASQMTGAAEQEMFERLPPVPRETTDRLCRELLLGLLPAAETADIAAFGEALYRYNRAAGECFAAAQGGAFAGPTTERLVRAIRELGVAGVGQSSWGPVVFALVADSAAADQLAERIRGLPVAADTTVTIAAPANSGAKIEHWPIS